MKGSIQVQMCTNKCAKKNQQNESYALVKFKCLQINFTHKHDQNQQNDC